MANSKKSVDAVAEKNSRGRGKVDLIDAHVGRRLKMRRIMLGLSQQDLSASVNVSIQQIQKYEKATNRISSGRLFSFARLLRVPVSYFYDNLAETAEVLGDDSYNFAEAEAEFANENSITERELVSLVKYFNEVKSPVVRKKFVELMKSLASLDNATIADEETEGELELV